jgi:hypothetical protein
MKKILFVLLVAPIFLSGCAEAMDAIAYGVIEGTAERTTNAIFKTSNENTISKSSVRDLSK